MAKAADSPGKTGADRVRLAHIGIAVPDLDAAREKFAALLGATASPIEEVATEGVRVSFFELENCRIELLEGTRPDSPISRFLAGGRQGVHHLAFSTSAGSLSRLIESFREREVPVIDETPRRGAGGSEAVFVHPRGAAGVLVEFVDERGGADA